MSINLLYDISKKFFPKIKNITSIKNELYSAIENIIEKLPAGCLPYIRSYDKSGSLNFAWK